MKGPRKKKGLNPNGSHDHLHLSRDGKGKAGQKCSVFIPCSSSQTPTVCRARCLVFSEASEMTGRAGGQRKWDRYICQ